MRRVHTWVAGRQLRLLTWAFLTACSAPARAPAKPACACAECQDLHAGQPVFRWYTLVSVDACACTMKIKRVNCGMQPESARCQLGEVKEMPCSGDNGY